MTPAPYQHLGKVSVVFFGLAGDLGAKWEAGSKSGFGWEAGVGGSVLA